MSSIYFHSVITLQILAHYLTSSTKVWTGLVNPDGLTCDGPADCSGKLKWIDDNSVFEGTDQMESLNFDVEGIPGKPYYYMQYLSLIHI